MSGDLSIIRSAIVLHTCQIPGHHSQLDQHEGLLSYQVFGLEAHLVYNFPHLCRVIRPLPPVPEIKEISYPFSLAILRARGVMKIRPRSLFPTELELPLQFFLLAGPPPLPLTHFLTGSQRLLRFHT